MAKGKQTGTRTPAAQPPPAAPRIKFGVDHKSSLGFAPPRPKVFNEVDRGALLEIIEALLEEDGLVYLWPKFREIADCLNRADIDKAYRLYKYAFDFRVNAIEGQPSYISSYFSEVEWLLLRYGTSKDAADRRFLLKQKAIAKEKDGSVLYGIGTRYDEASSHLSRRNEIGLSADTNIVDKEIVADRIWSPRRAGRPAKHAAYAEELFAFIRDVYGDYIKAGRRDEVRSFIYRHDKKLYLAITNFEKGDGIPRSLPADIEMPNRTEKVQARLAVAMREGLKGMPKPARRSVTGKLRRTELKNQK